MTPVTSPSMRYSPEEVWFPCSLDIFGWDEKFHQLMLNDALRMAAYEAAVKCAVRPGVVVLDLGTGTGILAEWALQAGASIVYGIEVNGRILNIAKQKLQQAGFGARFVPVNALSFDAELPEKADLIISEIIGNFGDNEDCHRILADARTRFLKPGGQMLPERVTTFLVPVSSTRAHAQIRQGKCKAISESYNLEDLLRRLQITDQFSIYYDVILPESCYLARPQKARVFDLAADQAQAAYEISLEFPVTEDGLLTGFKGYFVADLAAGITLDISGSDIVTRTASDSWKHCYLPIPEPLPVRRGEAIAITLSRLPQQDTKLPFSFRYRWQANVRSEKAGFCRGRPPEYDR